jgi:hypothetical protein
LRQADTPRGKRDVAVLQDGIEDDDQVEIERREVDALFMA